MSCRKFLQLNFPRSRDFLQLTLIFYKSYFLKSTFYKSHSSFLQVFILKNRPGAPNIFACGAVNTLTNPSQRGSKLQNFRLRRSKYSCKSFSPRVKITKFPACGGLVDSSREPARSNTLKFVVEISFRSHRQTAPSGRAPQAEILVFATVVLRILLCKYLTRGTPQAKI